MPQYKVSIVGGIKIQKDRYTARDPAGNEKSFDAWQFEASAAKEATVRWFKRLKTTLQVEGEGKTSVADIVLDMRSHHLGLSGARCDTDKPLPLETMGVLLAGTVARFAHKDLPVRRVLHQTEKKTFLLAVHDPMWWAGTVHKLEEFESSPLRYPLEAEEKRLFAHGQLVTVQPS